MQYLTLLLLLLFAGHRNLSMCICCRPCAPARPPRSPRSCPASAGLTGAAAAAWQCSPCSMPRVRASSALAGRRQRSSLTQTWTAWRCLLYTQWHIASCLERQSARVKSADAFKCGGRMRLLCPLAKHRGSLAMCSSKAKGNVIGASTWRPCRAAAPPCPLRASWQAHASAFLPYACV